VSDVARFGPERAADGGVTADGKGEVVLVWVSCSSRKRSRVTRGLAQKLRTSARSSRGASRPRLCSGTDWWIGVHRHVRRNLLAGGLLVVAVLFIFSASSPAGDCRLS